MGEYHCDRISLNLSPEARADEVSIVTVKCASVLVRSAEEDKAIAFMVNG